MKRLNLCMLAAILLFPALSAPALALSIGGDLITTNICGYNPSAVIRLYQSDVLVDSQVSTGSYFFDSLSAGTYEVALMIGYTWKRDSIFITMVDTSCLDVDFIYTDNPDPNSDNITNISDIQFYTRYFMGFGGPQPRTLNAGDYNCSGHISGSDAFYLFNSLNQTIVPSFDPLICPLQL